MKPTVQREDSLKDQVAKQAKNAERAKKIAEKESEKLRLLRNKLALENAELFVVVQQILAGDHRTEIIGTGCHHDSEAFGFNVSYSHVFGGYCNIKRLNEINGITLQLSAGENTGLAFNVATESHYVYTINKREKVEHRSVNYVFHVFRSRKEAEAYAVFQGKNLN